MAENKPVTVSSRALAAAKKLQTKQPNEALSLASGLRIACNTISFDITEMAEEDPEDPRVKALSDTIADILGLASALDASDEPF